MDRPTLRSLLIDCQKRGYQSSALASAKTWKIAIQTAIKMKRKVTSKKLSRTSTEMCFKLICRIRPFFSQSKSQVEERLRLQPWKRLVRCSALNTSSIKITLCPLALCQHTGRWAQKDKAWLSVQSWWMDKKTCTSFWKRKSTCRHKMWKGPQWRCQTGRSLKMT